MKVIYVDNNATTRIADEVFDAMSPFLTKFYGNPSSIHSFGGCVAKCLKKARCAVAELIGAENEDEVIFTSCGTESNNAAIFSALETMPCRRHIVTTAVEHPAVKNVVEFYGQKGWRVTIVPVNEDGELDMDFLKKSVTDDTALVSVMYANNETGVLFPIDKIADIVKEKGAFFHCDAVQAVGKIKFSVRDIPVDFLSLSGHKLHAPKGVGALYVRKGIPFRPFMIGGHQEFGRRGGTENVASIVALGKAAELAAENINTELGYVKNLRDKLEKGIISSVKDVIVNGGNTERLPNTTNISFKYVEGESILLMLDQFGIAASSGSACTSGSLEPSHVLRAMNVSYEAAHGSVRFSLSRYNTEDEMVYILEKIPGVIERLREISPYYKR